MDVDEPRAAGLTIAETVAEVLAALGVSGAQGIDGTTYAVGQRPFAIVTPGAIEFLLDPQVAAAAARTPGVTPAARGRGWVRFSVDPESSNPLDVDRVEAWLRLAHRGVASAH